MMIMTNDTVIQVKKVIPEYTFQTCPNCSGYGAKGNNPRVECPSCKGKGVLQIPIKEEEQR